MGRLGADNSKLLPICDGGKSRRKSRSNQWRSERRKLPPFGGVLMTRHQHQMRKSLASERWCQQGKKGLSKAWDKYNKLKMQHYDFRRAIIKGEWTSIGRRRRSTPPLGAYSYEKKEDHREKETPPVMGVSRLAELRIQIKTSSDIHQKRREDKGSFILTCRIFIIWKSLDTFHNSPNDPLMVV